MEKTKLQPLKGFRDFLPEEALKRQWLIDKIRRVFEQWGYDPIETPTLEPLEIFEGQIGEDEKLFYKFEDLGGRKVALRYDQTVPTCRVISQYSQDLPLPFKRYQIQPTFRAENPQKGRYREFLQCDADIFGIESPYADAEVIALSLDIYRRLGFKKAKALISDRSLFKDFPFQVFSAIDKIKKIGETNVVEEIVKKGISKKKAKDYLSKIRSVNPNKTLEIIFDYLNKMGFEKDWYEFDPTITRAFSYSTGPIWEVVIPGFDAGSVLGGERYDQLVKNISGKEISGTGFGLGFDRTLEAAEQFDLIPKLKTNTQVLVTVFSPKFLDASINVVNLLRRSSIACELYPDSETKIDKQLKYADKKGIPWVVIIGPEEAVKNMIVLKDMKNKKQETISSQALLTRIK
ncbi:histidine--tRNA ligase [Candidatus Woesebacteria bacterium RBG_16_34_12]|uniref:Histidine--tRNA ligase n=1 Tax=Candidatus Woesebacteria bacterium RBG_16_34_12 TaxID=1802480 RepID=A0A1F7X909_9BACT|nr:MAG: histidine--tRNA ligase [Candidatus Woesebacteria bacterium RBG_16_34_12]